MDWIIIIFTHLPRYTQNHYIKHSISEIYRRYEEVNIGSWALRNHGMGQPIHYHSTTISPVKLVISNL